VSGHVWRTLVLAGAEDATIDAALRAGSLERLWSDAPAPVLLDVAIVAGVSRRVVLEALREALRVQPSAETDEQRKLAELRAQSLAGARRWTEAALEAVEDGDDICARYGAARAALALRQAVAGEELADTLRRSIGFARVLGALRAEHDEGEGRAAA
jgi:hypothetical protein